MPARPASESVISFSALTASLETMLRTDETSVALVGRRVAVTDISSTITCSANTSEDVASNVKITLADNCLSKLTLPNAAEVRITRISVL